MSEQEEAQRRRDVQRGLMVELMNMEARAVQLEQDLVAWRNKWLAAYLSTMRWTGLSS